jgi:uncharacterized membrane protein
MTMTTGRRATDEIAGEFEFTRTGRYPCEEHADWLRKLDDRMWAILVAVCAGALTSVVTLLVLLVKKG